MYITLNCHISATFHTIIKINFRNFANNFVKKILKEYIKKNSKSHIFKHLHSTTTCFDSNNFLSFKIIDKANSKFDLRTKEALHNNWRKPNLNA